MNPRETLEQIHSCVTDMMQNLQAVKGGEFTRHVQFLTTATSMETCLNTLADRSKEDEVSLTMIAITRNGLEILLETYVRALDLKQSELVEAAAEVRRMQSAARREIKRSGL